MIHSIRYSSQYLYFKDILRVSNPDFLYGLSVSFMGATGVVFPLLISPYIDRTRNIKVAVTVVNLLGLLGNLLYALPFSPALPLIGQLLAGTTPAFGVIAMGEISRCYSSTKLTKKVSGLSLVYSIGTFTSIGLVFCFLYVDFDIGALNINYANMPGLFLTLGFTVSTVLAFFLVSDVSKDFDMKLEDRINRSSCASSVKRVSTADDRTPDDTDNSNRSSPGHFDNGGDSSTNINRGFGKQIPLIIEPTASTPNDCNDGDLNSLSEMERRFKTANNDNNSDIDNGEIDNSEININGDGEADFSLSEEERRFKVIRDVGQPYFFNMSDDGSDLSYEERAETSLTTHSSPTSPKIMGRQSFQQQITGSDVNTSHNDIETPPKTKSPFQKLRKNFNLQQHQQQQNPLDLDSVTQSHVQQQQNTFSFPRMNSSNNSVNSIGHSNSTSTVKTKKKRQTKGGYERLLTCDPADLESGSSSATSSLSDVTRIDKMTSSATSSKCDTIRVTFKSIGKILRHRTTAVLMAVTFMEAFVYSIIVTTLPVLATKFLGWGKLELALLSMVNKFLSVIISGSVYFLTDYLHDFLLLCYGICLSILALLTLAVLHLIDANTTALIGLFFAVATLSIAGVPLIITSTRSMLAKIVPTEIQSLAEAVRMSIFEASFVPAGFLVPLVTMNVSATALILLMMMGCVLVISIRQMKVLVELKEDDDYWQLDEE